ncbi:hypothetical protein [Halomonas alimentaria]|uniref:Uncharacterized protein n=1 Tax=Halomonas alimentaria TaxID=147248 RepID=A0A7X4W2Q1_9GAMM|nr:hypothetical protein [Halomonas alimentaria]NAW33249.1 hypothetical protein [Halomonas alimentaria]
MSAIWPVNTKPVAWGTSRVTEGPVVPPEGERRAWPFVIAWPPSGQNVQERYRYLTEIQVSRSGREYRAARRDSPRHALEFSAVLFEGRLRDWQALVHRALVQPLVLPQHHTRLPLPADMPAGTDVLYLAEPPEWLLPGLDVILGDGPQREALTVIAVEGNLTFFAAGPAQTWPAGTPLYAGLVGVLEQAHQADLVTAEVATLEIAFQVRPLSEPTPAPGEPERIFNGREVFLMRPNWVQPVSQSWVRPVDELDYGTGPTTRYSPVPFAADTLQATYVGATRDQVQAIGDLFHRMRGRQGEFYAPSWLPDLPLREGLTAGATTLRVQGQQLAEAYAASLTHRAVFVRLAGGELLLRQVESIALVDDTQGRDSLITLDAPWAESVPESQIVMAGWLLLRRFASDDLTIEWRTSAVATMQFGMLTLEALPPEALDTGGL